MTWFQQQRLMHRIAAHVGRGEHEEVVRCAELALRDRPRDTTLMSLLSASLDELHQNERAAHVRSQLLEIDPEHLESLFLLGRYHERRDPALACRFYERFLNSKARTYKLLESDFRFIRFVTGLISRARPDAMESFARDAERRLDRESVDRRKHAAKYLSRHARDHPDA